LTLKTSLTAIIVAAFGCCATCPAAEESPIVSDDFSVFDPAWGAPVPVWTPSDNKLISRLKPGRRAVLIRNTPQLVDADVRVKIVQNSGNTDQAAAVIFWAVNTEQYHIAFIQAEGVVGVLRRGEGKWFRPASPVRSDLVRRGLGQANELRVVTSGTSAAVYVNGKHAMQVIGKSPGGETKFGLFVESGDRETERAFSEFSVRKVSPELAAELRANVPRVAAALAAEPAVNRRTKLEEKIAAIMAEFAGAAARKPQARAEAIKARNDSLLKLASETENPVDHRGRTLLYWMIDRYADVVDSGNKSIADGSADRYVHGYVIQSLCKLDRREEALSAMRRLIEREVPTADSELVAEVETMRQMLDALMPLKFEKSEIPKAVQIVAAASAKAAKLRASSAAGIGENPRLASALVQAQQSISSFGAALRSPAPGRTPPGATAPGAIADGRSPLEIQIARRIPFVSGTTEADRTRSAAARREAIEALIATAPVAHAADHRGLSILYYIAERYDDCVIEGRLALENGTAALRTHYYVLLSLIKLNRVSEALSAFCELTERDVAAEELPEVLAVLKDSIPPLIRMLSDADQPTALNQLIQTADDVNRKLKATADAAPVQDPKWAQAFYLAEFEVGRARDALRDLSLEAKLTRLVNEPPVATAEARERQSAVRQETLKNLAARAEAERSTDYRNLAWLYQMMGRHEDVVATATKAITDRSVDVNTRSRLVGALCSVKRTADAVAAFRDFTQEAIREDDLFQRAKLIEHNIRSIANLSTKPEDRPQCERVLDEAAALLKNMNDAAAAASTRDAGVFGALASASSAVSDGRRTLRTVEYAEFLEAEARKPKSSVEERLVRILTSFRGYGEWKDTRPDLAAKRKAALDELRAKAEAETPLDYVGLAYLYEVSGDIDAIERMGQKLLAAKPAKFADQAVPIMVYANGFFLPESYRLYLEWIARDVGPEEAQDWLRTVPQVVRLQNSMLYICKQFRAADHATSLAESGLRRLEARSQEWPAERRPARDGFAAVARVLSQYRREADRGIRAGQEIPHLPIQGVPLSVADEIKRIVGTEGASVALGKIPKPKSDPTDALVAKAATIAEEAERAVAKKDGTLEREPTNAPDAGLSPPAAVSRTPEEVRAALERLAARAETEKSVDYPGLIELYTILGRRDDAADAAEESDRVRQGSPDSLATLIECQASAGRLDEALAAYRRLLTAPVTEGQNTDESSRLERYRELGTRSGTSARVLSRALLKAGRPGDALRIAQEAKTRLESLQELAKVVQTSQSAAAEDPFIGNVGELVREMTTAYAASEDERFLNHRGPVVFGEPLQVGAELNRIDRRIAALRMQSDTTETQNEAETWEKTDYARLAAAAEAAGSTEYDSLMKLYAGLGRGDDVSRVVRLLIERNPNDKVVRLAAMRSLNRVRRREEALRLAAESVEVFPDDFELRLVLVGELCTAGKLKAGADQFHRLAAILPPQGSNAYTLDVRSAATKLLTAIVQDSDVEAAQVLLADIRRLNRFLAPIGTGLRSSYFDDTRTVDGMKVSVPNRFLIQDASLAAMRDELRQALVGRRAPAVQDVTWLQGPQPNAEDPRGGVTLIALGQTMETQLLLKRMDEKYRDAGLQIVQLPTRFDLKAMMRRQGLKVDASPPVVPGKPAPVVDLQKIEADYRVAVEKEKLPGRVGLLEYDSPIFDRYFASKLPHLIVVGKTGVVELVETEEWQDVTKPAENGIVDREINSAAVEAGVRKALGFSE
jgi:hypothetical protein